MYIQITNRCNMSCAHCAFSCTAAGEDMTLAVFKKALELDEHAEHITIGGGEPTLHPLFWDFVGLSVVTCEYQGVYVITNGTRISHSKRLAQLARSGIMGAALSQDQFHHTIDPTVIKAFTKTERYAVDSRDLREIRSVRHIINVGRAEETGVGERDGCACDDIFVTPDGSIWACAHLTEQFGTVFDPQLPENYYDRLAKCSIELPYKDRRM